MFEEDDPPKTFGSKHRGMPHGKHVPNKAERKLLAQMMQASGKTEEQIRADKGNRQKLAAAQKSMSQGDGSNAQRLKLRDMTTWVAEELGLSRYDPKVLHEVDIRMRPGWTRSPLK